MQNLYTYNNNPQIQIMKQSSGLNISPQQEQLRRWMLCFVLVAFDVDEGQKIQQIVPKIELNQDSMKQIAMLSFPDSNCFNDYQNSFKYTFRMYNGVYGYACFKQKKDGKNSRGFSQRSLVILSELPFVHFFQAMAQFIVFKTFNSASDQQFPQLLNNLCKQVSSWPQPSPKSTHQLPILDNKLTIQIPNYLRSKQKSHSSYGKKLEQQRVQTELKQTNKQFNLKNILTIQQLNRQGPFQEIKLCQIFANCSDVLWGIWESVMLNKSLLILGANPQQVSHAVLGAISLIYPFQYTANFNPYVTVYDPHLNKISGQPKNWVMGGTNPLFSKFFNKQITQIISLQKSYKCPKHLNPLKQLIIKSNSQQQQAINESAIRKYFYQISRSVMNLLDSYFNQQTNNLKFFNQAMFLKDIKDRKDYMGLEDVFVSRKYVYEFYKEFINTTNFDQYLLNKNAIRAKFK